MTLINNAKSPRADRRVALLICNGTFPNIPDYHLDGPTTDAKVLKAILSDSETCRFDARDLVDRGLLEVRREIARVCAEARSDDTLLLYYSGGAQVGPDGSLFLRVADSDPDYPGATALDTEFVLSQLRMSQCRKIVLLIDTCFAGAFFDNNRGIPNGLYAITSCGATEMCPDSPEGGVFTLAMCAGLREAAADANGDGLVSVDELYDYVRQKLKTEGYTATPQKWVWNVPEPINITTVPRHFFLSYAREDLHLADQIAVALRGAGLSIWVDRTGVQSGNWKERVTRALNKSRGVVVLLTANALRSDAVRKELSFAARKNVPIVPVEIGEMRDELLPDWFVLDYGELHRHAISIEESDDGMRKLASALRQLTTSELPPERATPPSMV